jgi:YihY family inner membrane protein
MSSVRPVSQTGIGAERQQPWLRTVLREQTMLSLARGIGTRFRYGDGFSHARALGLLLCLALVPMLIALTGLADKAGLDEGGRFLAILTLQLTPGRSDALIRRLLLEDRHDDAGEVALMLGLITGVVAVIAAMGQIQRGANRLYGIQRDRSSSHKYGRAALLALLGGVPAIVGFVLIVAGPAVEVALKQVYGWGSPAGMIWTVLHLPVAGALTLTGMTVLFRHAPRRCQPPLPWLIPGVLLSVLCWSVVSALLAVYVNSGLSFSAIYGPMAGMMALLLWANGSGVALFLGLACCAELEARRAEVRPARPEGQ